MLSVYKLFGRCSNSYDNLLISIMAFSFVELTHCFLFGLLHLSFGQTVGQETGSDVSIAIEFRQYPKSCREFQIYFLRLAGEERLLEKIMSFSDNGDKCLSVVSNEYVQRICNAEIKFPNSVAFILRNVSFLDTGKYFARSEGKILGERIMFVTDRALRECTGHEAEINFVLPLSPFKEVLVVMFYPMIPIIQPSAVIQVSDTVSGNCATIVKDLQCKINRYSLSMIIKSVRFINEGTYALIGNRTGVVHESAILLVIGNGGEGCSTLGFTTHWMVDSSLVNGEQDCSKVATDQMVTVIGVEEDTIIESAGGQSFMIQKEYFIVGGAVAVGLVLVIITCLFVYRRCQRRSGNIASDGSYKNTDVHFYSTLRIQPVSNRVDSMRSFTESQRQRAMNMNMETNVYDEVGFDMVTDTTSEVTNPSETYYITLF